MKRRLIGALAAGTVYAAVSVILILTRGKEVNEVELGLGTVTFTIVFFCLRWWLDRRRHRSMRHGNASAYEKN